MTVVHPSSVVHQESRDVRGRPLLIAAIVAIAVGTAAVGIETFILDENRQPIADVPKRPIAPASTTSPIEQTRIDLTARGLQKRAAATRRLQSWGWVDEREGIAHVPVDEAISLMLAEKRNPVLSEEKKSP